MQTNTPSGAPSPTLLGSCVETPICIDSDSSESDPKQETDPELETDPEEETLAQEDSGGSGPLFRITFAGGPTLRRTTRKNSGSRYKQAKMEPPTALVSITPLRFVSARDHPLPALGTGGWLDE
ncbi:hypothetical protein E2562_010285 [Oryza meyeriana var. granulata]|uniref:Uncharacterized protein n=1 Tax=Oryza meyeriana var. granulata TaxID=110450 RepID=A0A6G1EL49_9ORYZ|nr:hypothetical protein E2562_010285 [Oryza meyeriana var. granulata]